MEPTPLATKGTPAAMVSVTTLGKASVREANEREQKAQAETAFEGSGPGWNKAKNVIFIFLQGGPSHLDLWDPKTDVPDNVKSVFQPINTKLNGIQFSELLPKLDSPVAVLAPGELLDAVSLLETAKWLREMFHGEGSKFPLLAGRDFTARDDLAAPAVAIVSRQFVNAYFPNESPLGKRLLLPMGVRADETTCEIVGVVNDVKHRSDLGREAEPELYLPYAQLPFVGQMSLVVRATVPAAALARDVQRELAALDREVSLRKVRTYEQHLGAAIAQPRLNALLFGLFALLAFALGVIGLYGVMAYAVTQRTREIGVRLALGARTPDILAMVLGQGMRLALLGVAIGIGAALALTRLLTGLLFGVAPADPLTFIAVPLALALVALLACWLPARRAMQVDPMTALREE